jgi:multicomponent Na+:H+ antiporter subunit D
MWMTDLPPFVPFFIAALLAVITRGRTRNLILLTTPVLAGMHLWLDVSPGIITTVPMLDYELVLMRADRLSLLFGYLFHIAAFIAAIFSLHVRDTTQTVSSQLYAGSALGAVFAGDLITLFIFWELMAISSVFLVWARRTERAIRSGMRYLVIQVTSGVLLLAGALLHYHQTGSLAFEFIGLEGISGWLIFLAFGIKCAFPLLHNWLTDAYPEGTPTGTVFLSAFTTKVAVYALARAFPGTEILVYIGAVMTCFPIFYAVIENDLRRVLGYSMINQIGFMVTGVGIGTALGVNGAVAHAFNDVIFKGLLFMGMGSVLHMTGKINGSDLGGLYKSMPFTAALTTVGAASISAFPLFSGFVSKSMVMAALLQEGYYWVWPALLFASAGVFHHAGIKIPYFAFFAHDSGIRTREPPRNMLLAMSLAAVLCVGIGTFPQFLYALLPFPVDYWPYDLTHALTQTQLLFFGALAFVGLQKTGIYPPELVSTNIDAEWVYRWFAPRVVRTVAVAVHGVDRTFRRLVLGVVGASAWGAGRLYGPAGVLARHWPTGSMVVWVTVLLAAYLLLYFL